MRLPLFGRRRRERELSEEIRSHIEMAVGERVARGESRREAERAVRREFGNEARVKEVTRTMWGGMWLDRLGQDVRFGIRALRRDLGFFFAAVAILTVGIGANAIVFTLARGVLLDAPPGVEEPSELVSVTWLRESGGDGLWSYPDYQWVRRESTAFAGVLAYVTDPLPVAVTSGEASSQATAWAVSDNFFDVLGTPMALGRGFLPEEGRTPWSHPVVVLSHGFWERGFGADSGVLGRTLSLNGTTFTVVGVAHRDFRGISPVETPPDVYVPLMMQGVVMADSERQFERIEGEFTTWYRLVARLDDGVTVEAAQTHMEALKSRWAQLFGPWAEATGVDVAFRMGVSADYRFRASVSEDLRRMIGFLAIVVAAVLLIGCANLALLLLARAPARRGEMGVRAALGAGRWRIVRQLLTEATLLAAVGGVGGVAVAYWGAAFAAGMMPYSFAADFTPDRTVLLFTGAVTLVVTAVFGLAPALHTAVRDIAAVLRGEGRVAQRSRVRSVLVVAQVAVSVVLVAGAGIFVRSLLAARSVDLGFEPDNVLVMRVGLANHGYDEARGRVFVDQVLERARALPGVEVASVTTRPPFSGQWTSTTRPEGTEADASVALHFNRAGPGYFEAMGIPVVEGRAIGEDDVLGAPPVLMLNETTAERLWPGQSAVGKIIGWRGQAWTVVGVAADAKYYTLGDEPVSQVYVPPSQDFDPYLTTFVLRTSVSPAEVAPEMENAIREVDEAVAVFGGRPLDEIVSDQASSYRAMAVLVGTFGVIALLLAAVGLYGVLAYLVGQSSREIGIRMALGARSSEVAGSILMRGSALAVAGTAIGLGVAWLLAGLVRQMLFGVEPQDPVTLSVVAAVLLAVTLVASYLPARRAARVDPMVTLREA